MIPDPTPPITFSVGGPLTTEVVVPIAPAAAPELVDLMSIAMDLLIAMMSAAGIKQDAISARQQFFLRRACWDGALIAYARCFVTGKGVSGARHTAHPFLPHLPPDLRKAHDRLLLLREKQIGHQVAPHGGQTLALAAGADFADDDEGLEFTHMFVSLEQTLYDADLLDQLAEIAPILRGHVGARIDELRGELLAAVVEDEDGVKKAVTTGRPWPGPRPKR